MRDFGRYECIRSHRNLNLGQDTRANQTRNGRTTDGETTHEHSRIHVRPTANPSGRGAQRVPAAVRSQHLINPQAQQKRSPEEKPHTGSGRKPRDTDARSGLQARVSRRVAGPAPLSNRSPMARAWVITRTCNTQTAGAKLAIAAEIDHPFPPVAMAYRLLSSDPT